MRRDPRQIIKIVVYTLLLVNWVKYFSDDLARMTHTVSDTWTLFDWTSTFATTLDVFAWLMLLALFELETYLLSDDAFTRTRLRVMHGLRLVCVVAIGHTVIAFGEYLYELTKTVTHLDVALCSFADTGLSFTRNLDYWELDSANCGGLSADRTIYQFDKGQLLSDAAGLRVEWGLAWADFLEVVVWLLILALIETMVRMQDRGVTGGRAMRAARIANGSLYLALWVISAYWASLGHWVFAWDEALWILGFMAINMNLSDWREEIEAKSAET